MASRNLAYNSFFDTIVKKLCGKGMDVLLRGRTVLRDKRPDDVTSAAKTDMPTGPFPEPEVRKWPVMLTVIGVILVSGAFWGGLAWLIWHKG